MAELTSMMNIGKEMARKLEAVGIESAEKLLEAGSQQAFLKLKGMYPQVRNHLYQNDLSWNSSDFPTNAFTDRSEGPSLCMDKDTARKKLEEAPELMKIRASISFDKLKNMDELAEFMGKHETYYLYCPMDVKGYRYWGFSPEKRGYDLTYGYDSEKYPYLDISEGFKIFDGCAPGGKNFINTYEYVEALDYIREHGVKSYGVVVYAAKQELLEMLEDSSVDGVYMLDGKIDLKF